MLGVVNLNCLFSDLVGEGSAEGKSRSRARFVAALGESIDRRCGEEWSVVLMKGSVWLLE